MVDVRRAYPDFHYIEDVDRGRAKVPGDSKAAYRIAFKDAKVGELTRRYTNHGSCQ